MSFFLLVILEARGMVASTLTSIVNLFFLVCDETLVEEIVLWLFKKELCFRVSSPGAGGPVISECCPSLRRASSCKSQARFFSLNFSL